MASHFHRPSSFQFPRGPPSPPDTNSDMIIPGMPVPILPSNLSLPGPEFGLIDTGFTNSSPDSRMRKSSSIPYHPSGLRDVKDRPSSTHQKGAKSLVIVIPPSTLFNERAQAQASNNGPNHRLSQGIIMPLFPSMFGQLTAIAREFNFPSTSGVCLYFHYVEGEFTLTPRISEESWPTFWSHLSDPSYASERRALISGKIEFDIDHRLARWYGPWLSSIYREASDGSQPYPHTAPYGHFRGESRTTTDGRFFDEDMGENAAIQQHSAPVRHAPRKLSLVERFESPSVRSDARPIPLSLGTPPDFLPAVPQALSPIRQEDEPKSARKDLNSRVKSWRASAQLSPTPLAATGQTSLEPPNLPNTIVLNAASEVEGEEKSLNIEDFAWSISSVGPQSEGTLSPTSWVYTPSVHLDRRLMGSVCSTPSVQTSAGPSDYDPFSPGPSQFARIPSPDIAHRFYEDALSSPSTATTWGAPLSYPPSPVSLSRVPSPDIGHRHYEYTPSTPMTATTWGAPLSYPPSPMCLSPAPSLDLGERSKFDDVEASFHYGSSVDTSSYISSSSEPWSHVWPYTIHENSRTKPNPRSSAFDKKVAEGDLVWRQVWPYNSRSIAMATNNVSKTQLYRPPSVYPVINIYPPVYPYFDIYPAIQASLDTALSAQVVTKAIVQDTRLKAEYPSINIYADVYPYNLYSIYPSVSSQEFIRCSFGYADDGNHPRQSDAKCYPHNLSVLYPPTSDIEGYPRNLDHIYENANSSHGTGENTEGYPFFNLYPPTMPPFFAHLSLQMYGPKSQYPDFEIYSDIPVHACSQSKACISKSIIHSTHASFVSGPVYPIFNLYPAIYPFFDLYPPTTVSAETPFEDVPSDVTRNQPGAIWQYPTFNLYPAVYPYFDIYPAIVGHVSHPMPKTDAPTEIRETPSVLTSYPFFNLYPGIYPFLQIYPAAYGSETRIPTKAAREDNVRKLAPTLGPMYPSFNLYPSVYPHIDIYPGPYGSRKTYPASSVSIEDSRQLHVSLEATYPSFTLYPSVYPYFNLYPAPYFENHPIKTKPAVHRHLSSLSHEHQCGNILRTIDEMSEIDSLVVPVTTFYCTSSGRGCVHFLDIRS